MSRWFRKQVERCLSIAEQPYFTEQRGITFCSRCGFSQGLHESIRAQMAKAKGERT